MKHERQPEHQIDAQQAERLFAKVARFAQQHGAHLTRKDHDTSWFAPGTGELCVGTRFTPQQALERIVYETASLLNSEQPFSFEQKRRIAAATTRDVLKRYGRWERTTTPTDQEIFDYYVYTCRDRAEYNRMLETTKRIRKALAEAKQIRVRRMKPKLVCLDRSFDLVMTQGGSLIRVQKPGVKEWPSTQVKITERGYFKLVYEALGHYRQDEHGWYRVSDGSAKHGTPTPSDPAGIEEGATREPDVPPDECPF
jgi:hypothetical protein